MPHAVKKTTKATVRKRTRKNPEAPEREVRSEAAPEVLEAATPAAKAEPPELTLQASRKFWMLVLGAGLTVLALVQAWGYTTAWGNPEKVIQRHFDTAQRLTLAKRLEPAIREYEKILRKTDNPETIRQARIGMAELSQENKNWKQAIDIYKSLVASQPNPTMAAWAELKLAESLTSAGELAEGMDAYKKIMANHPQSDWDAEARLGMAKIHQNQGQFQEAIAVYLGLEKDYRSGFLAAEALTQAGLCYEKMGRLEEAKKTYQTVLANYPEMMQEDAQKYLARLERNAEPEGVRTWGE